MTSRPILWPTTKASKKKNLQCFKAWSRKMAKCIKASGKYFEGDNLRSHKNCMCYLKWTWHDMCLNNVAVLMINMAWFKIHLCHSVGSLGKTLYGIFPCLVVLASSSKFQSYLYKTTSRQQYLSISDSRWG